MVWELISQSSVVTDLTVQNLFNKQQPNAHQISTSSLDSQLLVDVSDKAKAFLEAYRAKYNEDPSTFAALAYDSVYLVANAAKGAKTSVDIKNNLAKTQNFEGVTGQTSFDADHNTVKTAFMMTMNNGKVEAAEVVKP